MAASEFSKAYKAMGIEGYCGLGNRADDIDESYVFETESDSLPDDAIGSKGVLVEDSTGNVGSSTEATVKQVDNLDAKVVNPVEAAVDKVGYQNGGFKTMAGGRKETYDDLEESESCLGPVESQDSQAGDVGLVVESSEQGGLNYSISWSIDGPGNVNDECENHINSRAVETSEANQGSQVGVVDPFSIGLFDLSFGGKDETEVTEKEVETAESESLPSTSLTLNLELHPITDKEETLEEELMTVLVSDVTGSNWLDTVVVQGVQAMVGQVTKAEPVLTTDCHVETSSDLISEENNEEDSFEDHIDSVLRNPVQPDKHCDGSGLCCENMQAGTEAEASLAAESCSASNACASQTKTESSDAKAVRAVSSSPLEGTNSDLIVDEDLDKDGGRCTTDEASSGSGSTRAVMDREPTFQGGENNAETEDSSEGSEVAKSLRLTTDVKLEPEVHVHNFSDVSGEECTDSGTGACRTEPLDPFNVSNGGAVNAALEMENLRSQEYQPDCVADCSKESFFLQENEANGNSHSNDISESNPEGTKASMIHNEGEVKTETKPFNFLVRIPRVEDDSLREQIRLAKLLVDEKTKLRDAIRVQFLEKRASSQGHGVDYEYAKGECRIARKLVMSKRMEIDSLHSLINKAKNALSVEDIDSQIYKMEHMSQHETLSLKEEKQLLQEIKQLKQLRVQLSSNMGNQDEIKQALEQRNEIEERLKKLRKELDVVKDRFLKSEAEALEAEKKYGNEHKAVKELQAQFRAADDGRQAAHAQLQSLRKELSEKNKHFFKYKDDAAIANNYAFTQDMESLNRLCKDQVDNFMELWNINEDFRMEYVRFNAKCTARRDGCTPGHVENLSILPCFVNERVSRMISTPINAAVASRIPIVELNQETTIENVTADGKSMNKLMANKNQIVTDNDPCMLVVGNGLDNVSVMDRGLAYEVHEEPMKSVAEVEADEMRREEAEAKLKEERRLQALAKASEARERKRRQAEKLQMRAELKTQKEAEQKEKGREKRLRKRDRKKVASPENHRETGLSFESTLEISSKDADMACMAPKRSQRPWVVMTKQSKSKSIPPPLRNRNKKKLQQWLCVGITSVVIFILFWLGNLGALSNLNRNRRSPIY